MELPNYLCPVLKDNHGRTINYLRLAVTDRCNLRCFYCMPEQGNNWLARTELLSWEEMLRLCRLTIGMGVNKIRITGGEPFVRKGIMPFLSELSQIKGLDNLTITTNGVVTAPLVPELKQMGIRSVNLSLDTLDRDRFLAITHRDEFDKVIETMHALISHRIEVKINAVVMDGKNTQDIPALVALTKELPVSVRFIEEMPFNGGGQHYQTLLWDHMQILQTIKNSHPKIAKIPDPQYSTSYNYKIPGHKGDVGIIAAYTRSFCGTCNRIRLTPQGVLKTCLYDNGGTNLKDILRSGANDEAVSSAIVAALATKAIDGHEAERTTYADGAHQSMAMIGG
ncbi:GTP 3',8-cyclase MoaA [Flavipsychrobacter stenotrophus]|uniref:GTP 3',8-cyclase MoaA n=1 Tax=Flavipsychrobacter stenotrophus TaxID=2077091 RepID=UPI00196B1747|nr:GTP 3',8-cyclase MoaA [Flavipsychrobacter stenotrophus]